MGSNDPMMPQPRSHSQPAEDKTTHIYIVQSNPRQPRDHRASNR